LRLSGIVFQHDLGTDDHVVPAFLPGVGPAYFVHGVEVWDSGATPLDTKKAEGYFASGSLKVPKGLGPGKYLVRVDVADNYTPNAASAWQWAKLTRR
jgi:hypothetical protein